MDLLFIAKFFLQSQKKLLFTGERKQHIIKVRVRKKVSIPLKAPEAPLFKYVN